MPLPRRILQVMAVLAGGWPAAAASPEGAELVIINARDPASAPGLADPAALRLSLLPFLEMAPSAAVRDRAADTVLSHYQAAGWPVTEVSVAPRSGGGLEVSILEGRYGEVAMEGGTASQRRAIAASWQDAPGAPLTMQDVLDRLAWTHRNPLHAVTASFAPGGAPATADTTLTIHSPAMARGFAGWSNDGIAPLGRDRFHAGIEVADVLGLPFWLVAEAMAGEDLDSYQAARGSVRVFLPWRHELRFTGHWSLGRATGVVPGFASSTEGAAWFAGGRYLVPETLRKSWQIEWGGGADFFSSRSEAAVADLRAEGRADALHLVAETTLTQSTGTRESGLHLEAALSPGGIGRASDDADFASLRAGASADYFLTRVQAWQRRVLPAGWSLTIQTGGQWASAPVLPIQSFSPAGAHTVRGFPEASILGDSGGWGGLEVATPVLQAGRAGLFPSLQPVAFVEAGYAHDTFTGDGTTLAGSGAGLRLRWGTHAFLTADYGWRLTEPGGRAHLALRLEF